jgi:hypothetical protein
MSLVLCSNKDADKTARQEQSIYNAWSFTNALSSTYEIPENSQVCLQSAKVNLDGRSSLTQNNSKYYTWFGKELSLEGTSPQVDDTMSYPVLQNFNEDTDVAELTTDEIAQQIKDNFREYHPNKKGQFDCTVDRNSGLDFLGYNFKFDQTITAPENASSLTFERFFEEALPQRFSYDKPTSVFTRNDFPDDSLDPAVGIGLGTPISLANGSLTVIFDEANASGVQWGVGLSRDCPNTNNQEGEYKPEYFGDFDPDKGDETALLGLFDQSYYADFSVHRNEAGELVVRHAVNMGDGLMVFREVDYWNNPSSDFNGDGERYDIDTNDSNYEWVNFITNGEDIELYIGHGGATDLVCKFDASAPKETYFKPVPQTCWCLHPVLFVGTDGGTIKTKSLEISEYHGVPIAGYNSREVYKGGWFEAMSLLETGNQSRSIQICKSVDMRNIFNYDESASQIKYTPANAKNASSGINLSTAMILSPNETYAPTPEASTTSIFGFAGRSLVIEPTIGSQNSNSLTFTSDEAPSLSSLQSIFIRLKNFGQQTLNARTGNRSTILAHLPTADSSSTDGSLRVFYEPNNHIWLDLSNPYPMKISSFDLDFVYSNEQYARILQGQSIVMLMFRQKPSGSD